MIPIEVWAVGIGTMLAATSLLIPLFVLLHRRPEEDLDPDVQFGPDGREIDGQRWPWYSDPAGPNPALRYDDAMYLTGGSKVVPTAVTPPRPSVPPPPPRHSRADAETSVMFVVPAMCGCPDGGIRHLTDRSNPYCRRCGGAC